MSRQPETDIDWAPGNSTLVALLAVAAAGALIASWGFLHARDAAQFTHPGAKAALQLWAALIGVWAGYGLADGVVMTRWSWQLPKTFQPRTPRISVFWWGLATALALAMVSWLYLGLPVVTAAGRPVHLFAGCPARGHKGQPACRS